ncbi:WD40 repeat domain-containing protein [Fuerstiella marisgermanici]|uniref:WD40 repeat domain-containing protein n=1 Tax=Fuerstiella marisgermanici TaxID=1891926 RepID=UPI00097C9850|nr:PD40 domain-containing protein [Fuerstiella marisgermanici]
MTDDGRTSSRSPNRGTLWVVRQQTDLQQLPLRLACRKPPARRESRITTVILLVLALLLSFAVRPGEAADGELVRLPRGAVQRLGTTHYRHPGRGKQLHFVAKSNQIVICSETHGPQIFDALTGRPLRKAAPGAIGRSLLSATRDGKIAILTRRPDLVDGTHAVDFRMRRGNGGIAFKWNEPPSIRTRRMACSPDGKLVVTVTSLGHLTMRDVSTGEITTQSKIAGAGIRCIDWSADGRWIAFATRKGVVLWEYANSNAPPKLIQELGRHPVDSLRFSHDSTLLAIANSSDTHVQLFSLTTQSIMGEITTARDSSHRDSLCFSPNDKRLYVPNLFEKCIDVFDVDTAEQVDCFEAETVAPSVVAMSDDGTLLVAAGDETPFVVWDVASKERVSDRIPGHRAVPAVMEFSDDGKLLASGDVAGTVNVWDVNSGSIIAKCQHKQPPRGTSSVLALAFSPDSKLVASCGQDNVIRVLHSDTGDLVKTLPGHGTGGGVTITELAFSQNGKQLRSYGSDDKIRRWTVGDETPLSSLSIPYKSSYECCFDRKSERLFLRTTAGLFVYDLQTGKEQGKFLPERPKIRHGVLLPDAEMLVGSSNKSREFALNARRPGVIVREESVVDSMLQWHPFSGQTPLDQKELSGTVTQLSASHDGQWLAVCSSEHGTDKRSIVNIWDTKSRQPIRRAASMDVQKMALSPDGRFLATSYADTSILLWEIAKLQRAE